MILTDEQCKWLEKDAWSNSDQFVFVGVGKATTKEIEELKDLDELKLEISGHHLVKNFEDLK